MRRLLSGHLVVALIAFCGAPAWASNLCRAFDPGSQTIRRTFLIPVKTSENVKFMEAAVFEPGPVAVRNIQALIDRASRLLNAEDLPKILRFGLNTTYNGAQGDLITLKEEALTNDVKFNSAVTIHEIAHAFLTAALRVRFQSEFPKAELMAALQRQSQILNTEARQFEDSIHQVELKMRRTRYRGQMAEPSDRDEIKRLRAALKTKTHQLETLLEQIEVLASQVPFNLKTILAQYDLQELFASFFVAMYFKNSSKEAIAILQNSANTEYNLNSRDLSHRFTDEQDDPTDEHKTLHVARSFLGARYVARVSQMKLPEIKEAMTEVVDAIYEEAKDRAIRDFPNSSFAGYRGDSLQFIKRLPK